MKLLSVTSHISKSISCTSCQLAKSKRLSFPVSRKRSSALLDLIHCDLWGPSLVTSTAGFRYYVIFVNDYSRFTWFYPLHAKSDFYATFISFQAFVENQFGCTIKRFQSDGVLSLSTTLLRHTSLNVEFITSYLFHILLSKTEELNANIDK